MKNKGFSLLEILAIMTIGIIIVLLLASIVKETSLSSKERNKLEQECQIYKERTMENIPAKCLEYFNVYKTK